MPSATDLAIIGSYLDPGRNHMWEKTEISLRRKLADISLSEWEKSENNIFRKWENAEILVEIKCEKWLRYQWEKTDYSQSCLTF